MMTYFKSQRDLSEALIKSIDDYWSMKIAEKDLINYLEKVYENNTNKVVNDNGVTSVVRQRLGKKRLELLIKVLGLEEENR